MRSPENAHHELASSNSTASAFLGGRRNPAWMTAAPPPSSTSPTAVLPRKRPAPKEPVPPRRLSKQGPPRPASSASPKSACAPVQPAATAVPQNASSPASPALPNVVASQTAQSSHAVDNNVLPSPAPSEDMSAERGRAATVVSLEEDESEEEASPTDAQVPEGNGSNVDDNEKPGESLAERRNVSLSLNETRPRSTQPDQAAGSGDRFQRQSAPWSAGSRPHSAVSATTVQPAPATAPSTRLASPQVQTPVTSPPADLNLPRWRTLPPQGMSCYATEFCLAELQHLNARSGNGKSLAGVEKVRVDLMVEAVMSSDRYYLIFHQIMCIGALSQDFLPPEIATLHGTAPALELLNHLVQTSHVSKGFLEWFADFPVNLHDKKRLWSEEYGQQLLHFKQFVALANGGWERLQAFCFRKQLPPTSIEIGRELGMRSRLFQTIINRAILRRLCNFQDPPTDDQSRFLSEAEKSFKEHQTRIEQLQPSVTQELAQEEQNAELWYRERAIQLKSIFNVAFLYQAPTQNTPQTRPSPQQNRQAFQSLPNSPAQQHMLPSELHNGQQYQPVRPRVSTEIPIPPSNEPPVAQYGPPTPASTMSPFSAAAMAQHQSFHQNQQQPHQLIQHGGQVLMGPPNGVVTMPQSHNGHVQNWQLAQLQSPMSPMVPAGWQTHPNGAYQQPIYHQQRPLAPAHPYNNVRVPPPHVLRTNSAPVHGAAHPASPRQNSQAEPQHQLFVPPPGHLWTPQMVDPDRTAMHQAHLKSPLLKATPDPELGRKLYQSVSGFAVAPTKLADNIAQQIFQFTISAEEKSSIPPEQPATLGVPATRLVSEASKMYRLRCVKTKNVEEHRWVLQDSAWPAGMFLTFNGQYLEPRKKGQHGKDLPIDISPYIREGANSLEVNFLRRPDEERASAFAIAVEIVGILRHRKIKESCSRKVIPANDIVASIKRGLSGPEDDDECAIVDSNVTINLFEPFSSSRIYDIPVRGRSCLHRDCFDLEVFLKTRDRKDPSVPCSVDVWKCPICRADARPDSLIIDGFLVDVRKKLAQSGQINTRAIIVDGNGNWKPKPEDKQDTPHASREPTAEENRSRATTASATARMPSTAAEIIELD